MLLGNLTPRRRDVLRCLVAGMSQREAADRLFVSQNTVRTHVQGLFRQLGFHSTRELVALARRSGVAPISTDPDPRRTAAGRMLVAPARST